MNESTVSSTFQTLFRQTVPGAEVIKHADKSMIGMCDASITFNKKTLWLEYKFIGPKTKGVHAGFMRDGLWNGEIVAEASPTQFAMMKRLAKAGNAFYISWVLDHKATRKKVGYISLWHPITSLFVKFKTNQDLVTWLHNLLVNSQNL